MELVLTGKISRTANSCDTNYYSIIVPIFEPFNMYCTLCLGHCSIGALGDSFFEYLVKSWVGTSEKDVEAKDMYFTTMKVRVYQLY